MKKPWSVWLAASAVLFAGLLAATSAGATASHNPTAHVAYAGSLADLMDNGIGPAVARQDHFIYQGRGAGSFALAQEIKAKAIQADVFYSIGTAPFATLGKRAPWSVAFATAPLVLAYNPSSPFAPKLRAIAEGRAPFRELFTILASPKFHLGRTNPETDPQGRAFYLMVVLAQKLYGLPAHTVAKILGAPENPKQIFSETGILTELQAGALDAASAFLPEALERHLAYVPLPNAINFGDEANAALYREAKAHIPTVGTVSGTPLTVAATAILGSGGYNVGVRFLATSISPSFRHFWTHNGYRMMPFKYTGARVPLVIRHESP